MRLPVTPNRDLGQHFLVDENILGVIGRLAELAPDDVVLEVGPGLGVLTVYLADRVARVHSIELDRSLEPHLVAAVGTRPNVELVFGDALTVDIAVETLERLPTVERWCVMVQREVAERFFASPGTKAYGAVSVLIQLGAERTGFHSVSRTVFRPPPNVDSALVAFRRRPLPACFGRTKLVVEAAFAHRRKTLPNSVALAGLASRAEAEAALASIGRGPATRAEALSPDEFLALTAALAV
jgi:16S rRNA (adenine1518-N6/adenine1519-N6)-dimethyltransferase